MLKFAGFMFVGLIVTLAMLPSAHAATATSELSWDAPTTRVDVTPLAASDIQEYQIFYAIDDTPSITSSAATVVSVGESVTILTLDLPPREAPYVVSFAILTVDTDGLKSPLSDAASKTFNVDSTAAPGAPTNLQFTIVCGDGCEITEVVAE